MNFKDWLKYTEDMNSGGFEPPPEKPLAAVKSDQSGAFPSFDKDTLPPTKTEQGKRKPRKTFREWLELHEDGRRTGSKTGLYSLGSDGIGLYPPQDYLTHAADAITYLTMDDRIYKCHEPAPFDITHLKPAPTMNHTTSPLSKPVIPAHFRKKDGTVSPGKSQKEK